MTVRVALQGPQTQAGVGSPAAPAHAQPPASPLQVGLCFPTPCCCTARRRHWRQRLWNVEASERILCSPVRPAQVAVGLLSCLREACCPSRWSGAAFPAPTPAVGLVAQGTGLSFSPLLQTHSPYSFVLHLILSGVSKMSDRAGQTA